MRGLEVGSVAAWIEVEIGRQRAAQSTSVSMTRPASIPRPSTTELGPRRETPESRFTRDLDASAAR